MSHGQPPHGMPMIFGLPVPQQREMAPARVIVALNLLDSLTRKTEGEVAIWDTGSERYDGQRLTEEELNLQATACNLVTAYLNGTYKQTDLEKRHNAKQAPAAGPGRIIGCVGCGGQRHQPDNPNEPCVLCGGTAFILITPVREP